MAKAGPVLLALVALAASSGVQSLLLDDAQASAKHSSASMCSSAGHAGGFHHNWGKFDEEFMSGDSKTFLEWNFNVEADGCYLVEAYHPDVSHLQEHFAAKPGLVPVRVDYCRGATARYVIDQSQNTDAWREVATLPFYVDSQARIALQREGGHSENVCPDGNCLWIADAFRLRYLAQNCGEDLRRVRQEQAAALGAMPVTTALPTSGDEAAQDEASQDEVQAELQRLDKDLEIPEFVAPPPAALQMTLSEPRVQSGDAKFVFDIPQDGCYMVEERHPHNSEGATAPLTVNYCKGQKAEGVLNHADGKHDQWNYVASLPFYEQGEGSVVMPRSLWKPGDHQFRLTLVGPRCSHSHASVLTAKLRIKTDFSLVKDKIREFKTQLSELLSPYARVHPSRLRAANVYAGSIVADVTLLPPNSAIGWNAPPHSVVDAWEAVANLQNVLATSGSPAAAQICSIVGAGDDCVVNLEAYGLKAPLVRTVDDSEGKKNMTEESFLFLVIGGACLVGLALLGIMMCICFSKKTVTPESNQDRVKEESVKEVTDGVVVDIVEAEKEPDDKELEKGKDDDASTATPKDFEAFDDNLEIMTTSMNETISDGKSDGSGSKTFDGPMPQEQQSQEDSHSGEAKLRSQVEELKQHCRSMQQTQSSLDKVRDAIHVLDLCPGLSRAEFHVPLWAGTWVSANFDPALRTDQEVDTAMHKLCAAAPHSEGQGQLRAAETSEIEEATVEGAPLKNTASVPLMGTCPRCDGRADDSTGMNHASGHARVCWDPGAELTAAGRRTDCGTGKKAVMCVLDRGSPGARQFGT